MRGSNFSTVMMVDDQLLNLMVMEGALESFCEVIKTTSPNEALVLAGAHIPELVLLDIEMPGMDGFEVCSKLKNNPKTANIGVIFVTSHNDVQVERKALELGAIDFITKPVNIDICGLRVANHLQLRARNKQLKVARQKLHAEKELLQVTLNSIGEAVITTDCSGNITYLNPVAERLTGWLWSSAIGVHMDTVMVLCDAVTGKKLSNPLRTVLQQKRPTGMVLNAMLLSKDGKKYRIEDTASPIFDREKKLIAVLSCSRTLVNQSP